MKENYLFEYAHSGSLLNRVPPLVKLSGLIIFCILTGILKTFMLLFPSAFIILLLIISDRRIKKQAAGLWKLVLFFTAAGLVRSLGSSPEEGINLALRLILMMFAGLLFYTTTKLSDLRKSIPGSRASELTVMTLAVLPLVFKTMNELKQARYSRCFGKNRSPLRAVRYSSIPLMINMFIKTDEMADAWYSRAYGLKK